MGFLSGLFGGGGTSVTTKTSNETTVDVDVQNTIDLGGLEEIYKNFVQSFDLNEEKDRQVLQALTTVLYADAVQEQENNKRWTLAGQKAGAFFFLGLFGLITWWIFKK